VAVNFPFIVCFPNESDESLLASIDVAKRLRAMSPNFQTPIYYFKPYPGTPITDDAIREGFEPAQTLEEWADFDWYQTGPWVTVEREQLIERFTFYQQIAFDRPRPWQGTLQRLARWRCAKDFYRLPLEMLAMNALAPTTRLS
jgi:anaerobic magnesium-protoporphyrin IX monomethyl ester cyclase